MSRMRAIRNRKVKRQKSLIEIDITSLLDILVILLVFLLRSYNSSGVILNVPADINLPNSQSIQPNSTGVVVQVSKTQILVDDKEVLNTSNLPRVVYDKEGRRIISLYNELMSKKEEIELLSKKIKAAQQFNGVVNLVVDKTIKYSYLKKLMYTIADAGFRQYKFVVLGESEATSPPPL